MRLANGFDEFYSRNKANGDFEYFVDDRGNYKRDYPHIHVIFHELSETVEIISSQTREFHRWRTILHNPDGNEVNNAIREASSNISW
jgi:hypothetical protein